jgi:hypothetical protein
MFVTGVNNGSQLESATCLLKPQQRTNNGHRGTSASGHVWTAPAVQEESDFSRRLSVAVLVWRSKVGPNAMGRMVASGPQCAAKSVLTSVCSQCETPGALSFRRELWGESAMNNNIINGVSGTFRRLCDAWPLVGVGIAVATNAIWIAMLAYAVSLMF